VDPFALRAEYVWGLRAECPPNNITVPSNCQVKGGSLPRLQDGRSAN
jgi:hypothetical protein